MFSALGCFESMLFHFAHVVRFYGRYCAAFVFHCVYSVCECLFISACFFFFSLSSVPLSTTHWLCSRYQSRNSCWTILEPLDTNALPPADFSKKFLRNFCLHFKLATELWLLIAQAPFPVFLAVKEAPHQSCWLKTEQFEHFALHVSCCSCIFNQ